MLQSKRTSGGHPHKSPFFYCVSGPKPISKVNLPVISRIESRCFCNRIRADSRFAPSQWETALLCNDVSHWLEVNIESDLGVLYGMCVDVRQLKRFPNYWSFCEDKGQWYSSLVITLLFTWINCRTNSQVEDDFRRHKVHVIIEVAKMWP